MPLRPQRSPVVESLDVERAYRKYVAKCRRIGKQPIPRIRAEAFIAKLADVLAGRRKNTISAGGAFMLLLLMALILALVALAIVVAG